jgi:hypothetical protein
VTVAGIGHTGGAEDQIGDSRLLGCAIFPGDRTHDGVCQAFNLFCAQADVRRPGSSWGAPRTGACRLGRPWCRLWSRRAWRSSDVRLLSSTPYRYHNAQAHSTELSDRRSSIHALVTSRRLSLWQGALPLPQLTSLVSREVACILPLSSLFLQGAMHCSFPPDEALRGRGSPARWPL